MLYFIHLAAHYHPPSNSKWSASNIFILYSFYTLLQRSSQLGSWTRRKGSHILTGAMYKICTDIWVLNTISIAIAQFWFSGFCQYSMQIRILRFQKCLTYLIPIKCWLKQTVRLAYIIHYIHIYLSCPEWVIRYIVMVMMTAWMMGMMTTCGEDMLRWWWHMM